jgi:hypothetical protein
MKEHCHIYNNKNDNGLIDVCKTSALRNLEKDKTRTYFFPYLKNDSDLYDELSDTNPPSVFVKGDDIIYVELTWNNVKKYGTIEQLSIFDNFRKRYVKYLFGKFCNSKTLCKYERVGKKTPISDIDINLEKHTNGIIFNYDIHEIVKNIMEYHESFFKRDMEELFDINIYAAIFKLFDRKRKVFYIPSYKTTYEQRCWSCLRLVMIARKYNILNEIINAFNNKCNTKLINDTEEKLDLLIKKYAHKSQSKLYIEYLEKYYEGVRRSYPINKIIRSYSICKYFENDAYHSAGAYLHIVANVKNLSDEILLDSIYDNLGFMFESFLKNKDQLKKLDKIAKYLNRISDALKKMHDNIIDKDKLKFIYSITKRVIQKKKELKSTKTLNTLMGAYNTTLIEFRQGINRLLKQNEDKPVNIGTLYSIIRIIFVEILSPDYCRH